MPPAPQGPIAYCSARVVVHTDGTAVISVVGCVMNSDGTLVLLAPYGDYQFDTNTPVHYGMATPELTAAITNVLTTSWGITNLFDVKFIPSF